MSLWETSKQCPASNALSRTNREATWRPFETSHCGDFTLIWQPPDLALLPPLLMALSLVREIPHMFVVSGTAVWKWMDSVKAMYQQSMSQVLVVRNELKTAHDSWQSTFDQCVCGWGCSIRLQAVVVVLYFFIHSITVFLFKAKVSVCSWFSMCVCACWLFHKYRKTGGNLWNWVPAHVFVLLYRKFHLSKRQSRLSLEGSGASDREGQCLSFLFDQI